MYSLPFDEDQIEQILENKESVVDMSKVNFDTEDKEKNYIISMIYLRNLNYEGILDFSNVSYEDKAHFLYLYITRELKFLVLKQLDLTILKLLISNLDNIKDDLEISMILTDEEVIKFKESYNSLLLDMHNFIVSLPLLIVYNIKDEVVQITDNIEKTDAIPQGLECMLNLLDYPELEILFYASDTPSTNYVKVFEVHGNNIREKLASSGFVQVLSVVFDNIEDRKLAEQQNEVPSSTEDNNDNC